MNCLPCGGSTIAAIRPVKDTIDVNGGEEMPISDGVDVPIPVPREKEFGLRNPRKLKTRGCHRGGKWMNIPWRHTCHTEVGVRFA